MSLPFDQIAAGKLWDFPGGIHPQDHKTLSNQRALLPPILPAHFIIPLRQHAGVAGQLLVEVGQSVLRGQPLTRKHQADALPVHAPTSGTITAIEARTITHPSGLRDICIVLQPDRKDAAFPANPIMNYRNRTPIELIEHIEQAGIAGMGGAGFPTGLKLRAGLDKTELLIVNAAECEPYITADDRLMQEHAAQIIKGIQIITHVLQPQMVVIGIEDNKPEAVDALMEAGEHMPIHIRVLPTKYPSGGEKQLIQRLTGQQVPMGKLPADLGISMLNVATLFAIKRAVIDGEPLIQRVVTLTGNRFARPRNTWVRLGTPLQNLLKYHGYQAHNQQSRLIHGGPMMGFTLPHHDVPVIKATNCILAPTDDELPASGEEMPCIRCGACAQACPASLLPQQLYWHAKEQNDEKCQAYHINSCIECGICAFVCPSQIPLVHYYRQSKARIKQRQQEVQQAEQAKIRFEQRTQRLEREKLARQMRVKAAAEKRRQPSNPTHSSEQTQSADVNDAVAAAIARVKAKKAAQAQQAIMNETATPSPQAMGEQKAAGEQQATPQASSAPTTSPSESNAPQAILPQNPTGEQAAQVVSLPTDQPTDLSAVHVFDPQSVASRAPASAAVQYWSPEQDEATVEQAEISKQVNESQPVTINSSSADQASASYPTGFSATAQSINNPFTDSLHAQKDDMLIPKLARSLNEQFDGQQLAEIAAAVETSQQDHDQLLIFTHQNHLDPQADKGDH